jgi:NADP-dependent 3-hydroxy acid dehydrogenase YdfG
MTAGYTVYAGARRLDRMKLLADAGAHVLALDLTDDASMTGAVDTVMQEAGRIDVLINNAGYGSYGALEDVPLEEARRQFDVNLFGLARLTQLVLPAMRAQSSGGSSMCLPSAASSANPLAPGTTPPNSRWRG